MAGIARQQCVRRQNPHQQQPDGRLIPDQVGLVQFRGHPAVQPVFIPVKLSLALTVQQLSDLLLQLKDLLVLFSQFLAFVGRGLLIGVPAAVNEFLEKTGDLRPLRGMVPNSLRQLADRLLQRQMMLLHDGPQRTARV